MPIEIAIEKGAKTIYAIDVSYAGQIQLDIHGIVNIGRRCITVMLYQHLLEDLEEAAETPDVTLHHIRITAYAGFDPQDFSKTAEMIEEGKRVTDEYLASPTPGYRPLEVTALEVAPPPPGARLWKPRRRVKSGK